MPLHKLWTGCSGVSPSYLSSCLVAGCIIPLRNRRGSRAIHSAWHLDWRVLPVLDPVGSAKAYSGVYSVGLVATSVLIAILASFVALSISARVGAATTRRGRLAWTGAGAISMGGGIWAMHFIGMLAFSLPCGISYNPFGTMLSMLPGMIGSGVALNVVSRRRTPTFLTMAIAAVLMGGGIGAMHYSGMASIEAMPE